MRYSALLAVALATVPGLAMADPKFDFSKKDDVVAPKGPEWHATAEAGAVFTSGNANTTTITGGLHVSRKSGNNKFAFDGTGTYVDTGVRVLNDLNGNGMIDNQNEIIDQDTVTAETLNGKLRYDRFLTDFNSLYAAALASRDVPAGKLSVFGGQAGYSRRLYKTAATEIVAEIGYDFSREHLTTGPAVAIHSARAFVGEKAALSPGVEFDSSFEVLTNLNHETLPTGKDGSAFNDTRVNVLAAVTAKLGKNLALQTALELHYDNRPGPLAIKGLAMGFVPEAEPLDTIMKASLIYTFAGAVPGT